MTLRTESAPPPAIGIDARKARDFGIGTYTRALIGGLAALPETAEARFSLFIRPGDEALFAALAPPRFTLIRERARGYSPEELFGFGPRIRRSRVAVFHALHYVLPFGIGARAVVTIHDRIPLDFPADGAPPLRFPYARVMLRRALGRAAAVITAADAVRRELAELSPGNAEKIVTIPHGVAADFRPDVSAAEVARVRDRYRLPPRFALFLGGAKPHKNLRRVLEGFAAARRDDLELVLAGPLPPEPAAPGEAASVRRIGLVDDADLPALYRAAAFLLYPTLAEGFCFPLLEAMAAGVPAVVSDIPVCRELAAGAARLVDPRDPRAIARSIEEVAGDPSLRSALAARGLARAREFSWERTARRTWEVYRRALGDR